VFAGPNGDYPAVLEAMGGLTAAQALWKPAPGGNSILQIADHLTAPAANLKNVEVRAYIRAKGP
jgi:hypothetical protein